MHALNLMLFIYSTVSQNYIYQYHKEQLSFSNADAFCAFNYGTSLASIHDDIQNSEALSLCPSDQFCWIGLSGRHNESNWFWTDGTPFDYGTDINGAVAPWRNSSYGQEPNNYTLNENCVHLWFNGNGWNHNQCQGNVHGVLCNYPKYNIVTNGDIEDIWIPKKGQLIGNMYVLDEIVVTFQFKIYSFPLDAASLIHIGDEYGARYPAVYVTNNGYLMLSFSRMDNDINPGIIGPILDINRLYELQIYCTQNSLLVVLDNNTIYNETNLASHFILTASVYLSDSYTDALDGYLSNLVIKTSNSYLDAPFNYLCDYNNRFTEILGTFSYDPATCYLSQTEIINGNTMLWLGDKDKTSLNWIDYKVEAIINIIDEKDVGLLIRCQSLTNCYYVHINANTSLVTMGYIDNGIYNTLYSIYYNITFNKDYKLRVEAIGDSFDIYLNNNFVFNYKDNKYSSGSIGFATYQSHAIFKSLRVIFVNINDMNLITNIPSTAPTPPPILSLHIPSPRPTVTPTVSDKSESEVFQETSTTIHSEVDKITDIDNTSYAHNTGIMIIIIALSGGVIFFCMFMTICCILHTIKKRKQQSECDLANIGTGTEMPASNVKITPKLKGLAKSLSRSNNDTTIHYSPQTTNEGTDFPDITSKDNDGFVITVNEFHRINTELTVSTPGQGIRGVINHSPMENDTPIDMEKDSYLIKQWLTFTVKLPKYYSNFIENGYESMEFIKEIQSKQDLVEIGIHIKGHQTAIMGAIKRLRNQHFDTKGNYLQ